MRRTADEPLFNSLMEQYHYLGYEQPVGEHLKYLVWAQGRPVACLAWSFGAASLGQSRPLHRLERGGAAAQHPLSRLQHAISDSALGAGGALASHILGRMAARISRRLAADVRASDLFSGDVRRSGAIPRNLLPGGELGGAGQDDRARQAIQQPRAEPVDQRGAGIPADASGFASCWEQSDEAAETPHRCESGRAGPGAGRSAGKRR